MSIFGEEGGEKKKKKEKHLLCMLVVFVVCVREDVNVLGFIILRARPDDERAIYCRRPQHRLFCCCVRENRIIP